MINQSLILLKLSVLLITQHKTDKLDLEKKTDDTGKGMPDTNWLVKKTENNSKIAEIGGKIPSINGLATTAVPSDFENRIPNVSDLVKKTNYDAKISDKDISYFTTSDYSKFTSEKLNAKIKEKRLVEKSDISGFIDKTDLDKKTGTLKKAELKAGQDKLVKNQTFHSSYICGKAQFEDKFLVFQLVCKYFSAEI